MSAKTYSLSDQISFEDLILIPEGEYTLAYCYHQTWFYMGSIPKLLIAFRVSDFGLHYEKPLFAYFNLRKIMGKAGKNGKFNAGWRSRFMFEYAQCFDRPKRKDRISMRPFKENFVTASIRTVTHNRNQREYPNGLKYSVVEELLRKVEP